MAVTILKAVHIVGVLLWTAGLLALPILLSQHDPDDKQDEYARLRKLTHYAYTRLITPAAVIAVAVGIALIFLRETFTPWLFAKLTVVGLLVVIHALVGNTVVRMGEESGETAAPAATPYVVATLAVSTVILLLVLAKPAVDADFLPAWLNAPLDRYLPVDEVPT